MRVSTCFLRPFCFLLSSLLFACSDDATINNNTATVSQETVTVSQKFDVIETSIAEIQSAILQGETSCRGIVQTYLDRINFYDQSTGLNAITVINANALKRADEIDALVEEGKEVGPLFCTPILVKDNFDTHDMPTTAGSIALKDNYAPDDAYMVRKLREADAIVIAKTNMAEWAFSPRETTSSSYGTTANAYDLGRVPAGSSGGTASGVAANFAVAGMGSDTGNSIRGPSSHLALFGIRSTIGLTSRDGVIPLSYDKDIAGPMTRTVEDSARIFNVIAGYDPADILTTDGRGKKENDYTTFLNKDGLNGARIGVLRALVNTEDADEQIIGLFEVALKDLTDAGAEVVDPVIVDNFTELRGNMRRCSRFRYDVGNYLKTLGDKGPLVDVMEVLETGEYSPYIENALKSSAEKPMDLSPEDWDEPCPTYLDNPDRKAFLDAVVTAMDSANLDAIVYPTWTNPPAHLDKATEEYKGDNSQIIAPNTGMPAVTVPMGYSYGNLPAGLQILARRYDEGKLFSYAYAYEQATKHRSPPEKYPAITD